MRFVKMLAIAAALGGGFASAQALRDKVIVDLPYRVILDDKTTLEPGEYSIRQLSDSGGGRYVLQIRKDDFEHEALVSSIPATENKTQEDTQVMLHKLSDGSYRFDKIWVQGKDYGYEFPLPEAIRNREREVTSSAITARYDRGDATQEGQPEKTATDRSTAAITDQSGATASAPVQPQNTTTETVQNTPPVDQPRVEETAVAQVQETQPAQPRTEVAQPDGATVAGDEQLPQTASQWFGMLAAGLTLMGSGFVLRRK